MLLKDFAKLNVFDEVCGLLGLFYSQSPPHSFPDDMLGKTLLYLK